MKENKKEKVIQIRIAENERKMLDEIRANDPNFNVSALFRETLGEHYKKIVPSQETQNGIGQLQIG